MQIVSEEAAYSLAAAVIAQAKKDVRQRNVDALDRIDAVRFLLWVGGELDAAGFAVSERIIRRAGTGTRNGTTLLSAIGGRAEGGVINGTTTGGTR